MHELAITHQQYPLLSDDQSLFSQLMGPTWAFLRDGLNSSWDPNYAQQMIRGRPYVYVVICSMRRSPDLDELSPWVPILGEKIGPRCQS